MSQCPDCRNEFVQPFVCTSCGAQKLYDVTLRSAQDEIERLRALLAECRPHVLAEIGEWERLRERDRLHPDWRTLACNRIASGKALLDRIDAAVQEVKK